MVIANLSSTISLQFPVLLFSVVWSRSSLFCSCLLAGAPPSVAPLSGCLQEQRRDVTLRPSPIRLGPSSSSSQIHFMMEIAPICVQQHLCTPHVDHRRISMSYFWRIFSGERALVPVESRREISAGWEMMYGSGVQADADNTLLEYHPERSLETSPSRPETSQLWYGHYGNLCALDAFCVPAPVIETTVMHETVQMERGTINIFGGFKFLMARKSPQYILGCVWCVSMVPVYWAMLRAGWAGSRGEQILDTEIQSQAQYIPCHLFVNTIGKNSSLNARDSSFWRLFWGRNFSFNPGDNPIELDKTLLPAKICQHQWAAQHTPDFVVTQQTAGAFPETWNRSQQPRSIWLDHWTEWLARWCIGRRVCVVMERGKMLRWKVLSEISSQWLCQLEEEGRSAETNGSRGTIANNAQLFSL